MSELVGHQLGQYEILGQIAKGGMATVYRAHQKSVGRDVAIKVLPRNFTHEDTFLERFYREVEIIAKLQHPHILPVYDFGEYDDMPYIVMAYLSGGTLADFIAEAGANATEMMRVLRQIADALDFAHSKGIIHRDFKPANVLLDEQGNTYLADFGLAKVTETLSDITGMAILGTPTHMAPEQAGPDEPTPAVDVYALGITVYQLLTGKVPFESSNASAIVMAHVMQPVPDIRELRPDLPDNLHAVMSKVLAKTAEERYATAGEFVRDLAAVVESGDAARITATDEFQTLTALLMTNMLGKVIFMDNQALRMLKRHQHEARHIIGKPMHEVLGCDPGVAQDIMQAISEAGGIDEIALEITDSQGKQWQVGCSALATRDDDGTFVGADITLRMMTEATNLEDISSIQKPADTREENYLQEYFKVQVETLHTLLQQWAGKKVSRYLEDIINETGQRNVWPVSMDNGYITVQLKRSDTDIYQALLARAISYTAGIVGDKIVMKELQRINDKTNPVALQFVKRLGLDDLYQDILNKT